MFGRRAEPAPVPPAELMTRLTRRGPHKVLRGDLAFVGVPGQIFTPTSGSGLPLVVFSHAWMADSHRYRDLLFHLATHGIVAAIPDVERGPAPSDAALAAALRTALSGLPRVRLGLSESVTVDAGRRAVAGHGFGASAAVLALGPQVLAGVEPVPVSSLTAIFPAPTTATAFAAAASVQVPSMVLAAGSHLDTLTNNPLPLARELGGDVCLRAIPGATDRALLQKRSLRSLIGINGADKSVHAAVRALLTGFVLATAGGNDEYAVFGDPEAQLGTAAPVDPDEPDADDRSHVQKLLQGPATQKSGSPLTSGVSSIRALRGS
ncbi:MAG: alpha/beta hydrolase [Gordonia sp. (in: high G+C Gram-positive bacteria)]|uniref:poly(ethylene terephthalate) hydrolase family protein n=1 Tax=Gordonia sp. (in: high G+C Gram-positive bacteria) TaxID=84139 RepID=UPI0039E27C75